MAFYLVGLPCLDQLGDVVEDLDSFPFFRGVEDKAKVAEVADVSIIFEIVPAVVVDISVSLLHHLQNLAAFDCFLGLQLLVVGQLVVLLAFYHFLCLFQIE